MKRENTKQIRVGSVAVGGGARVSVQSMCCTKTWDVEEPSRRPAGSGTSRSASA